MRFKSVLLFTALLIILFGCNHHPTAPPKADTIGTLQPDTTAVMVLSKKINLLIGARHTAAAQKMIDSLILKNDKNASLFYEQGFIYENTKQFSKAIVSYQKAKDLGFDEKTCDEEISFCKQMMHSASH